MTDPSVLRMKLFIGILIYILFFVFAIKMLKQQPNQKIEGKGIVFYNVIGLAGLACLVILIISTYFD